MKAYFGQRAKNKWLHFLDNLYLTEDLIATIQLIMKPIKVQAIVGTHRNHMGKYLMNAQILTLPCQTRIISGK